MYYKSDINNVIDRYNLLWSREALDKILVKIDIQDSRNPTVMNAMAKAPNYQEMLDEWEKGFEINRYVEDDNLPVVYGELGSYIIGGFLGAKVRWSNGGAYSEKLIHDIKNYNDYLKFLEENEYYKLELGYTKFLSEKADDKFGFTEMLAIDGLNFLDCLRGADAYTDILDYPNEVHKILEYGSDLNICFIKKQREFIKSFNGGRFNFYQIWTPNETLFISVDAYGHCSPEIFEEFGRKYVQKLIDEFNGGWLHVHSDAVRLLPNYVKLKNILAIGLEDWIKSPRIIEQIENVKEVVGNIPLMINIKKEELIQMIDSKKLPGNILYWVNGVNTVEEANKIADLSHKYKAPYKK